MSRRYFSFWVFYAVGMSLTLLLAAQIYGKGIHIVRVQPQPKPVLQAVAILKDGSEKVITEGTDIELRRGSTYYGIWQAPAGSKSTMLASINYTQCQTMYLREVTSKAKEITDGKGS